MARPGPRATRDTSVWRADEYGQGEETEEEQEEEAMEVSSDEAESREGSGEEWSSGEEYDVTAAPVDVMRIDRWDYFQRTVRKLLAHFHCKIIAFQLKKCEN